MTCCAELLLIREIFSPQMYKACGLNKSQANFKTPPVSSQDRKQPDVCEKFFHDVPFEAHFASDMPELQPMMAMPGVDGFTMKVDALYKVCGTDCHLLLDFYQICSEDIISLPCPD